MSIESDIRFVENLLEDLTADLHAAEASGDVEQQEILVDEIDRYAEERDSLYRMADDLAEKERYWS